MTDEASRAHELVKEYAGIVVTDVARALAVIAIATRPGGPNDSLSEAALTAMRVAEAARLLCAVKPDSPIQYLTADEQAALRAMFEHFTPPPEVVET